MRNLLILCLFAAVLSGCAALSEEECQFADWDAIGQGDGRNGQTVEQFQDYTSACNRFGIAPDFAAWERGRQKGLQTFCTPQGVYAAGLRNRGSVAECGFDSDLARIHSAARRFALIDRQARSAESALNSLLSGYEFDRRNVRNMRRKLQRDDLGRKERRRAEDSLQRSLRDLDLFPRRQRELIFRLRSIERERTAALIDLSRIEGEFGLGSASRIDRSWNTRGFTPLFP